MSSWGGTGELISVLVTFLGVVPAHCRKGLLDFGGADDAAAAAAAAAAAGRVFFSLGG